METSIQLVSTELQALQSRLDNILELQILLDKNLDSVTASKIDIALKELGYAIGNLRSASSHLYTVDKNMFDLVKTTPDPPAKPPEEV